MAVDMRAVNELFSRYGVKRVLQHMVLVLNSDAAVCRQEGNDRQAELWEQDAQTIDSITEKIVS